ncbi:alpha/beta fold hydrolase [Nocardia sp. BMG111209]|uniref:alpha/beta fold hydrolase n=1 Tax=Nocardia sp. BMG111209 TaxID=1160137 RepID=UPI0003645A99|nr:alpha/beta hydrolase [Nocardia sp. BMG111209]
MSTHHRTITVGDAEISYREAGDPDKPDFLLLHGFPASSFMFRHLIELLADRFHLIAPDYPGFGHSAAPDRAGFDYTFDHLAEIMDRFTAAIGLTHYGLYLQDFGGPIGFRLATAHPERVRFLVLQNANAYAEGLPDSFWSPLRTLWQDPTDDNRAVIRAAGMSDAALEWNYTHGVADPTAVDPDNWLLQHALLARPGAQDNMLDLLYDYRTNPEHYPQWQAYLREHRPPTLITWGRNDAIFPESGAHPYLRDLPDAELHLLDTGHFALEDHAQVIAGHIARFTVGIPVPSGSR